MPALAVMVCFLLLAACAAPLAASSASAQSQPLRLTIVNEDEDPRLGQLLRYAAGGGLLDGLLQIEYQDRLSDALPLLRQNATDGLLVLPQRFLQAFLSGENLSARLITSLSAPAENLMLSQLVPAAEELLETGQGGVWAVLQLPGVQALSDETYQALYRDVNFSLLTACLSAAQTYIKAQSLPLAWTLLSLTSHYFLVFYCFFALLSGCFFVRFFTADKSSGLLLRLSSLGVGPVSFLSPKLLLCFFYQLALCVGVFIAAGGLLDTVWTFQGVCGIAAFALYNAALCLFLFTALEARGAVLGLVLLGFAGLFCTGGFLPPSYLPGVFTHIGMFLPAGLSYRLLAPLCGGQAPLWCLPAAAAAGAAFFACACAALARKK
ncbi:MAG: ABC transporter permease, partial [Oscillospiraceae bacterium]|nr:ABC transporter permease [Oscillospiraceae bacterium]